jgi:hypothetical protein
MGMPNKALVKEMKVTGPYKTIKLLLNHVSGKPPLLCGIELIGK